MIVALISLAVAPAMQACLALEAVAGRSVDAAPALAECINHTVAGGKITLRPGVYSILSPLVIDKPVMLTSRGLAPGAPACRAGDRRCAVLAIGRFEARAPNNSMPIEIKAPNVTLSHLTIKGWGGRDLAYDRRICGSPATRPLGGGVRVSAAGFRLDHSLIHDVACYTALEVTAAADRPTITDNWFGPNGDHHPGEVWADGATIHDTTRAIVMGNIFFDNTDVQLIFGGCRDCRIVGNQFRHGGTFKGASFAELMIHAWPSTSGRYDGTIVRANDIDCGGTKRCAYGIMIGSNPWYKARASGGEVVGNSVANARLGINVDGLTGPMTIRDNQITKSGGTFDSACGLKKWPAFNVARDSYGFVQGTRVAPGLDTSGCMLNASPD